MRSKPYVCFMTDFGLKDHYVAEMKAVLLGEVPESILIDLTHEIPPQNVRVGAYHLLASYRSFPSGTLFVCVVDPGVGSGRKIIYAETDGRRFLAPDNGLLSWIFEKHPPQKVLSVKPDFLRSQKISKTFHGRDIFAPFAAKLLLGEAAETFATPVEDWIHLCQPKVQKAGSQWIGEVIAVDHFGNLITNVLNEDIAIVKDHSKIWIGAESGDPHLRGVVNSYSDVEVGQLLAVEGSAGFLEISAREGNAQRKTGLGIGDKLILHFRT